MNHIGITLPSPNSNDQLRRQLQNVFRVLANPEHKLRENAFKLRLEVSSAWRIQAAEGKWFPWPTTFATPGARRLKGVSWRPHGMLGFLGYHVGETQPTLPDIRRCVLEYAFECHLPPLSDLGYYLEWGEPQTTQRLKKLADSLTAFTRNAKRRDVWSFATAIDDWESDLEFLRDKYYDCFFHFGWPATDTLH